MALPQSAYETLLALRTGLRHFERWSQQQAEGVGLTGAQHQLLLAIKGHGDPPGPTIGEVADYLLLRHHSAVGLVDRAAAAGLVTRDRDLEDRRVVRLHLTSEAAGRLERLSALHLEELERLASQISGIREGLKPINESHGFQRAAPGEVADVRIARVYDPVTALDGRHRVLIDRLWPRGLKRNGDFYDEWCPEVAPSTGLRKWYGHVPERYEEFADRYRGELCSAPASEAVEQLRQTGREAGLVLLTAAGDLEHSSAAVLRDVLSGGSGE